MAPVRNDSSLHLLGKILGVSVAVLFISFVLYRLTAHLIFQTVPRHLINRHTNGLLILANKVSQIEKTDLCGPLIVVAGSSVSREIELDVPPYKFINIALVGGSPLVVNLLQERLLKRLSSCPPAERIIFFEFMPGHLTKASLESYVMSNRLKLSYFMSYGEILRRFSHAPEEAVDILMMKLKGNTHAEILTSIFSHLWFESELRSMNMKENAEFYKGYSDIEDLNFSEENTRLYLQTLKNYQGFMSKVILHLPPENFAFLKYTPEGEKRLKGLEERLKDSTGLDVVHLSELHEFKASDFRDAIHLESSVTQNHVSRLLKNMLPKSSSQN